MKSFVVSKEERGVAKPTVPHPKTDTLKSAHKYNVDDPYLG